MAKSSDPDPILQAIRDGALSVARRYRDAWDKERARNYVAITDAIATKSRLPADYYTREHNARSKAEVAAAVLQALMDE